MDFRSDLAVECREYIDKKELDGIIEKEEIDRGIKITTIKIINENGERILGKKIGTYVTLEMEKEIKNPALLKSGAQVLSKEIRKLLNNPKSVMAVCLGNGEITSDALGPKCADKLFATRHISKELSGAVGLGELKSVCVASPGVLGKTGIESAETVKALCQRVKPDAVIAIDALAARNLNRLGSTVQMSTTGISPGSGVNNCRKELSQSTLGVPVIGIGVPTVVDGITLAYDILKKENFSVENFNKDDFSNEETVMVTPKEIDLLIERSSRLIAYAINLALQKNLSFEDITMLAAN